MDSTRNEDGTFAKGNPGGPGRPRRWDRALRKAAAEAVTTEHVTAIMRRATRMALEGNLSAMRFVVERTCGRPIEAPDEPEAIAFEPPRLQTAVDCSAALDRIAEASCKGELTDAKTKLLVDIVHARMKAIELNEHEKRLLELEAQSKVVETRKDTR